MARRRSATMPTAVSHALHLLISKNLCPALAPQAFVYKRLKPKHKDDTSAEGGFASVIHRLGSSQNDDTYLWSDPANPQHSALIPRVTDDGRHLVLDIFGSTDPVTRLLATEAPGLASRATPSFRDVNEDWDGSYYCGSP